MNVHKFCERFSPEVTFASIVRQTVAVAAGSPCAKSKRGVAIWGGSFDHPDQHGWPFLLIEHNSPPQGFSCLGREVCGNHCNKVAVHAEERALLRVAKSVEPCQFSTQGASMLHVKVIDGELVQSRAPSCWQCSRMILEAGVESIWLYHVTGWEEYSTLEFHQQTLKNCGLPGGEDG